MSILRRLLAVQFSLQLEPKFRGARAGHQNPSKPGPKAAYLDNGRKKTNIDSMDEQKDSPNASKTKPEMFAIWG